MGLIDVRQLQDQANHREWQRQEAEKGLKATNATTMMNMETLFSTFVRFAAKTNVLDVLMDDKKETDNKSTLDWKSDVKTN